MKNSTNLIGVAIGIAGVMYGLYSQSKMNKVASKLNVAISDLDMNATIDVPKHVIKTATDQAVTREVSALAKQAASDISDEITTNMKAEVTKAISTKFNDISENVSAELANQVSKINPEELSNKVIKRAEKIVVDKMDGALDGLIAEFNKDLKNVGKTYGSMSRVMDIQRAYPGGIYFR